MAEHRKISATLVAGQEEGSYVFKIDGYSRSKALLKTEEYVTCAPFSSGGHRWYLNFYLNGRWFTRYTSVGLFLDSAEAEDVKGKFTLSVLDKNGEPAVPSVSYTDPVRILRSETAFHAGFVKMAGLEESVHVKDDCLTIMCVITVMKDIPMSEETTVDRFVVVPPSNLHQHLGDLLKSEDAADVTFQVGERRFYAHRAVLAARSSVFKAGLLGAMKENSAGSIIEIRDMEADVFKSLLNFIYTDSVPHALQIASNNRKSLRDVVMAGHLLVAADMYDIARLKLICEKKLCNHIDSDMVATTLTLAEQHGFHDLKDACLRFLASPSNLEAMMASDGFAHLKSSCPSVLKELIVRILPADLKVAKDLIMIM
ncbi:BTB/POZ and MATH domain-containing protein 3-like [Lolium perenne]|uniref:BTB/POZ and MATH domain-containing protein 3-like n=1 Tax=Lolium perenne TaxID=4522 RepID=UPI0021F50483|nr:BTB/POZ and MATH domain-containing protein 3-like [Lolium perenne]